MPNKLYRTFLKIVKFSCSNLIAKRFTSLEILSLCRIRELNEYFIDKSNRRVLSRISCDYDLAGKVSRLNDGNVF